MSAGRTEVSARFGAIAAAIDTGRPAAVLSDLFANTEVLCERVAKEERSAELKALLTNVQTALRTWREVWPRLGTTRDFQVAVAREARLWAKRFSEAEPSSLRR
ncbi:MAG: hypothetical protein Q8R91_02425 [Candidatus Omnitrophota bacterium]|nr:hypothetical protein [Candidatus Omnitrophota bacterium]